jgi:hypothetical protein
MWFTPDVPGEPVRILIRYPTEAERRALHRAHLADIELDEDEDGNQTVSEETVERWTRATISECVSEVADYADFFDVPITDGAGLAARGEEIILAAVMDEITNGSALSESQKKTCAGSPASSEPEQAA